MSRIVPWLMAAGSLTLMGCILPVTPDFQVPPNTPSIVEGRGETPQREIIVVDRRTFMDPEITLQVRVTDPDIAQELRYLVYVDYDANAAAGRPQPNSEQIRSVPANPDSAEPERRDFVVRVPLTEISRGFDGETGCTSVQVRVNESYGLGDNLVPLPLPSEMDEGFGTWIVAVIDETDPMVDVTECPNVEAMMEEM